MMRISGKFYSKGGKDSGVGAHKAVILAGSELRGVAEKGWA